MEDAVPIKHVLVVEDEPAHSMLIARAFENLGDRYSVTTVGTLADARNEIEKQIPDIALVDFRLPDGSGDDFLSSSSELFPVILMTSHGDEQLAVKAIKAGAIDYIVKSPDAFALLVRTVDRSLREWRLVQERQQLESEREIMVDILRVLNSSENLRQLMNDVVVLLRDWSGCGAVGIRLRDGDDFPYFESLGFSDDFISAENSLLARDSEGGVLRDTAGNPALECMCGNVLCGRFDPCKPFFTAIGSFWSNSTAALLANSNGDGFHGKVRDSFCGEGYNSVALIPMRAGPLVLGLLQFNDRGKGRFTPWRIAVLERLAATLAEGVARRQAEAKLQESEEKYRGLIESSADHIFLLDLGGRFVASNKTAEDFGLPAGVSVVGRLLEEVYGPSVSPSYRAFFQSVIATGRPVSFEHRLELSVDERIHRDTLFPVSIGGNLTGVGGICHDITERRRVVDALRRSEDRYRSLFESSVDAIMTLEPPSWMFTSGNPATVQLFGAKNETEFTSMGPWLLSPTVQPDGRASSDKAREMIETAMRCGSTSFEWTHRRLNGEDFPATVLLTRVDFPGKSFLQATVRDITDQKRAEAELRRSEGNYRLLFSEMVSAFALHEIILDGKGAPCNYRFLDVNPSFENMTGLKRENVLGKTVKEVMPAIEARWIEMYGHVAMTGESVHFEDFAGEIGRYYEGVAFCPVRGQFAVTFSDITERRRIEDEMKRLNELLEERVIARTENLRAINAELESFIYSVSHDLRSPMQTMAGFSEALLEDYAVRLDEDGRKYLRYLHDGTMRMRAMVDGLLELSRAGRNELVRVSLDISLMAGNILRELVEKYPERTVEYSVADKMVGSGDERLVRNLLIQLVDNAWKFTGKTAGGRIDVGVLEEKAEKIFFIRDNGVGFDVEQVDSLFKPFRRLCAKGEFDGLGLGLAIVKRLVGRHGGRIWAEGKPGAGATFYFTLE